MLKKSNLKQLESGQFEWKCPECGKVEIIDGMLANYIYHSTSRVLCEECNKKYQ